MAKKITVKITSVATGEFILKDGETIEDFKQRVAFGDVVVSASADWQDKFGYTEPVDIGCDSTEIEVLSVEDVSEEKAQFIIDCS